MAHRFAEIAFTDSVKAIQVAQGSRSAYARMESGLATRNHRLTDAEASFITGCTSFYMATVGETGWPYIQHRGGRKGFVRVFDAGTIGFADYKGNRQYVSVGNLATDARVSLFIMDYAERRRLKLFGRARTVPLDDREVISRLQLPDETARIERGIIVSVEAFDWNCPQHITERYTAEDVRTVTARLTARIAELEAALGRPISGSKA